MKRTLAATMVSAIFYTNFSYSSDNILNNIRHSSHNTVGIIPSPTIMRVASATHFLMRPPDEFSLMNTITGLSLSPLSENTMKYSNCFARPVDIAYDSDFSRLYASKNSKSAIDASCGILSKGNIISSANKISTNVINVSGNVLLVSNPNYAPDGHARIEYPRTSDTDNVGADVLMGGGHSTNDIFQMKLTGMNTSGGDEGGVVYEFDDMSGPQGLHRNGAGYTDGINFAASIANNSPLDVIGGGQVSADGVLYTLTFPNAGEVCTTPGLSNAEKIYFRNRLRVWTNIAHGMANTEGKGIALDDGRYDLPNYYFGYYGGIVDDNKNNTCLAIQTYFYPSTGITSGGFRTMLDGTEPNNPPGKNAGDSLDNKIEKNTNYHTYTSAAIMLGGNEKDFNLYTLEAFNANSPSITRNYDNEFDHFIKQDHDKEVVTRGVTYSWGNSSNHPFADGSYGLRIAGFNLMPVGATIDGIIPTGGVALTTNGGFNIFRNLSHLSSKAGSYISGSTLGLVGDTTGYNQLNFYSSTDDDGSTGSVHLGIIHSGSTGLENNRDARCSDTKWITGNSSLLGCSFQGQVIYNPAGYYGGIALGSGIGINTRLSLISKNDGDIIIPKNINTPSINFTINSDKNSYVGSIYEEKTGNMTFDKSDFVFLGKRKKFTVYSNAYFVNKLIIPIGTPLSSKSTCIAGQIQMDEKYTYSCVSKNKWHRMPNGSEW